MVHYINSFPERKITSHGENYLYFGGTSYLGLQTDVEFQDLYLKNVKKYGTNYGASRKSNVRFSIYEETENYLAQLVGSESCITLSSGYLAGQFISQFLNSAAHKFYYAPNTHSALYLSNTPKGKPKSYVTFSELNSAVRDHLEKNKSITPVIFLDAIDFSGANFPHFAGLQMLPLSNIILIVDDSHGIGIIGENGGGIYRQIKEMNPKELIICSSLGKGFGIQAGAIFGTKNRILQLSDTEFFGGASPSSPAFMATLLHAEKIYVKKRKQLEMNTQYFISNLSHPSKFKFMKGHPAFSFANENLTGHLEKNKIIVTSFNYPNEDANLMSRIVISASHTEVDIAKLCKVLNAN
jgi:7-keto-8-aminopelargonate synthetase-like enzyme